ncbi:hypothetical protein A0H81_06869 [Grifola frondosa]|uniref:Uncharacterized protein n=1 Tax=Grifola frondosa TaxID=5627 RepID=A0A1C7M968_GRIFR|nr:hypothetical protein A0H81_06869 [Grifola frondosa]
MSARNAAVTATQPGPRYENVVSAMVPTCHPCIRVAVFQHSGVLIHASNVHLYCITRRISRSSPPSFSSSIESSASHSSRRPSCLWTKYFSTVWLPLSPSRALMFYLLSCILIIPEHVAFTRNT